MNVKIKRDAWIAEAFSALAEGGVDSIKIEVLAKRLRVTKGGFYWHFKNRNELLEQLLKTWRERRIDTIREQTAIEQPAHNTLLGLLELYIDRANPRGTAIELAVRDWARSSALAAESVGAVDRERLTSVAQLFSQLDLDAEVAFSRAYLFYSYIFGQSLLNYSSESFELAQIRRLCAAQLLQADASPCP